MKLTDIAAERIKETIKEKGDSENKYLRFFAQGGG